MSVFLGMRGTGDWPAGYRPENYREMILKLYPNGNAPLTAIMSMLKSERTDDPHFHWFEKDIPDRRATITGVFSGDGLGGGAYAPAGAGTAIAGDGLSFQMSAADVAKLLVGNTVLLRDQSDLSLTCVAKVTKKVSSGANSYIYVTLLEADDNGGVTNNLKNADICFPVGTSYAEGSGAASGQRFDGADIFNYTQIFKNALENTRTAMRTRLRTGNDVAEAKKECLELHSIDMELAFIFGVRSLRAGDNGKPERTTQGIKEFITTNKFDVLDETAGFKWLVDGDNWLQDRLEYIMKWGSTKKLMLCGAGVLTALNKLAKASGNYQLSVGETSYGIKVVNLISPHGELSLKTHPLFSQEPTLNYSGMVIDSQYMIYKYVDDTTYQPKIQDNDLDGEKSQYLTEAGLELHFEKAFSWFDNFGQDVAAV